MAADYKELEKLKKQLLTSQQIRELEEACAKELAARLLRSVVKDTPVGIYPPETGKQGGTLRRSWKVTVPKTTGSGCSIEVINPTIYASYVEYGHRQTPGRFVPALGKCLTASWVDGRFMLTRAENNLRKNAQAITDQKVTKKLEEMLNGK